MQSNIRILSTRFLDENNTSKFADFNINFHSLSFINTQPVVTNELTQNLQQLASQALHIVFTSLNAAAAVTEQLQTNNNWKIFCTSGRTKEYIINTFGEDAIVASAKNANLLAERIIAFNTVKKVAFFCGNQHLHNLPQKLKANGIQTDEIIVYTTVQTPVYIDEHYDGFLFFSPSAVHSFFSMNTLPTEAVLFSIGQTTTAVIQSYCANKIITSEWPGIDSLLELVTHFYNEASHQVE